MAITVYRMVFLEGADEPSDTVLEFCVSRANAEEEMAARFLEWIEIGVEPDGFDMPADGEVTNEQALAWCLAQPGCRIEEVVVEDAEALVKVLDEYGGWCRDHA